jgi:small subunit ribosomal protein S20
LANHKSAEKRIRTSLKNKVYNKNYRSAAKTYVARADDLIFDNQLEEAEKVIRLATQALDKAAQKGVIHDNNASRRKSRLVQKYNAAVASQSK